MQYIANMESILNLTPWMSIHMREEHLKFDVPPGHPFNWQKWRNLKWSEATAMLVHQLGGTTQRRRSLAHTTSIATCATDTLHEYIHTMYICSHKHREIDAAVVWKTSDDEYPEWNRSQRTIFTHYTHTDTHKKKTNLVVWGPESWLPLWVNWVTCVLEPKCDIVAWNQNSGEHQRWWTIWWLRSMHYLNRPLLNSSAVSSEWCKPWSDLYLGFRENSIFMEEHMLLWFTKMSYPICYKIAPHLLRI